VNFIYDWDWAGAYREFNRALELNPQYATAHQWYAWLLASLTRLDEALREARTAVELDPSSVSARRGLAWLYLYARQPEAAVPRLHRALRIDPGSEESHRVLGLAYTQAERFAEAQASLREAIQLSGGKSAYARASLGYLAARCGRRAEAEAILDELTREAASTYVSPVAFALVRLGLGDADGVFAALEQAYRERRGWLAYLKVEPLLDPVRGDPRFGELVRRMKLA
jgi:tetratricopeptide (TPR) repeat protein